MKPILLVTAVLLLLTGICVAADDGFESTSGVVTNNLLALDKSKHDPASNDEGWQPLNTPEKPEGKTQPIKDDGFESTSGGITESLL